jgi:hypothetical protein
MPSQKQKYGLVLKTHAAVKRQKSLINLGGRVVRIRSSRHYFCFEGCAAVRCTIGCLLALIFFLPFMQLENKNNGNYTL